MTVSQRKFYNSYCLDVFSISGLKLSNFPNYRFPHNCCGSLNSFIWTRVRRSLAYRLEDVTNHLDWLCQLTRDRISNLSQRNNQSQNKLLGRPLQKQLEEKVILRDAYHYKQSELTLTYCCLYKLLASFVIRVMIYIKHFNTIANYIYMILNCCPLK